MPPPACCVGTVATDLGLKWVICFAVSTGGEVNYMIAALGSAWFLQMVQCINAEFTPIWASELHSESGFLLYVMQRACMIWFSICYSLFPNAAFYFWFHQHHRKIWSLSFQTITVVSSSAYAEYHCVCEVLTSKRVWSALKHFPLELPVWLVEGLL